MFIFLSDSFCIIIFRDTIEVVNTLLYIFIVYINQIL